MFQGQSPKPLKVSNMESRIGYPCSVQWRTIEVVFGQCSTMVVDTMKPITADATTVRYGLPETWYGIHLW